LSASDEDRITCGRIRMKFKRYIFLLALVLIAAKSSIANEWDNLDQVYYYLNNQMFEVVSCKVEVPVLSSELLEIKRNIKTSGLGILIKEDVESFTVRIGRSDSSILINPPVVEFFNDEFRFGRKSATNEVLFSLNRGFSEAIDGISNKLFVFLNLFFKLDKEEVENFTIYKGEEGIIEILYVSENYTVIEKINGDHALAVASGNDGNKIYVETNYIEYNGLLLPNTVIFTQSEIITTVSYEYQDVQGVRLPNALKVSVSDPDFDGGTKFDMMLTNCIIEKGEGEQALKK
jgi:hypothetical protein